MTHSTADILDVIPPRHDDPQTAAEIKARMDLLDISNSAAILRFGSRAQSDLQLVSAGMLDNVRNKDSSAAGQSLGAMVAALRNFAIEPRDWRSTTNFWERLFGWTAPRTRLMARFEEVRGQIDSLTDALYHHEHALLRDIQSLDLLYKKTLAYYESIGLDVAAARAKIEEIDTHLIPQAKARLNEPGADKAMRAEELRTLEMARNDIERRLHDLRLTRQVAMQALPSIRIVQDNDKALVAKISAMIANTVPLWEAQLAQAITVQNAQDAAQHVRQAREASGSILATNTAVLRQANKDMRSALQSNDIESVRRAHADLIATIEESLAVVADSQAQRAAAEAKMTEMEGAIQRTHTSASLSPGRTHGQHRLAH